MAVQITHLTFEHHRDALGIGQDQPRLSWRLAGETKDWTQAGYEVEIVRSEQHETARLQSHDATLVPWPTSPLKVGEPASVRMRVFGGPPDSHPTATSWSDAVHVELGLRPDDWTALFVEPSHTVKTDDTHPPILFRREFSLKEAIARARLYVTAHGVYEAQINGQAVGDHVLAPGWTSYHHRLTYQTFDVGHLLKPGSNAIGGHVGSGWFCGRLGFGGGKRNLFGDSLGLLAQLVVTYLDGSQETVITDDTWRWSLGSTTYSELYDGEECDMRLDQKEWSTAAFQDNEWQSVRARPPVDKSQIQPPDAPPVRRIQEVAAVQTIRTPSGQVIIDFGQNLVGWLRVRVPGAAAGQIISMTHAEVLENGELGTRPLRVARAKDILTLANAEPLVWEPKFTFHGFRYVQIDGWPTKELDLTNFTAIVLHTDMERTGWFECSEPLFNKLHQNVSWGMRGNFLSVPTDCPQRDERLGWTGDLCVFAKTANSLYDTHGILDSWLRDVAAEQMTDVNGIPPLVTPNVISWPNTPQAIWGDVVVSAPWDLYEAFGDKSLLARQYESMKAWMDRGIPRDHRGLWEPSTWQLADWLDPKAPPDEPGNGVTDGHFVANAYLIRSTDLMVKISTVLGFQDEVTKYQDAAKKLRTAFAKEYITEAGRVAPDTQTAIALAVDFSLFPTPAQEQYATARLKHLIRSSARFKIATGFAGTPILGYALTKGGESQVFYRMLYHKKCPSWLYPVTMGATTVWERWDSMLPDGSINPGEMTSFNHYALGSVAQWMHTVMGGIRPGSPGWKHIIVEPIPGGAITSCRVGHLSPFGMISVSWKIEGKDFILDVNIPPNTTGTVKLPGAEDERHIGSGNYSYCVSYEAPEWPVLPIYPPMIPHDDDEP